MKNELGIVFIHGAGLGSYIWRDLKSNLNYPALAVDFPNRSEGSKANAALAFGDYTKAVINQIDRWGKRNIVLVVHSIGGCVGLNVANELGDRVVGFIAIGAVLPLSGKSFVSSLPFPQRVLMPLMLSLFGTKPPDGAIRKDLCNDLTRTQADIVVENFTPEARQLYVGTVCYKMMEVPRLYIQLKKDKSLSFSVQQKMAKHLNATDVKVLDSGHLPMISKPKELAGLLNNFIQPI